MTIIKKSGISPYAGDYPDPSAGGTLVELYNPATVDFYCNTISANFEQWTGGPTTTFDVAIGSVVGNVYTPRVHRHLLKQSGTYPRVLTWKAGVDFTAFKVLAGEYVCGSSFNGSGAGWYCDTSDPLRTHGSIVGYHIHDVSFTFTRYSVGHGLAVGVALLFSEEDGTARVGYVSQQQPVVEPAGNSFDLEVIDTVPIACSSITECEGGCKPIRSKPRLVRIKR